MRKLALVAVVASLAAASVAPSSASDPLPVGCRRSAGVEGFPTNTTIGGVCSRHFSLPTTTTVTVELAPSLGFTGVLTAIVSAPGVGGETVTGYYVGGTLATGLASRTFPLTGGAGVVYTLSLRAGTQTIVPTNLFPPLPPTVVVPGAAFGEFSASVRVAS